jgi:hypothetical protein
MEFRLSVRRGKRALDIRFHISETLALALILLFL